MKRPKSSHYLPCNDSLVLRLIDSEVIMKGRPRKVSSSSSIYLILPNCLAFNSVLQHCIVRENAFSTKDAIMKSWLELGWLELGWMELVFILFSHYNTR
jgi:hypothetical protein